MQLSSFYFLRIFEPRLCSISECVSASLVQLAVSLFLSLSFVRCFVEYASGLAFISRTTVLTSVACFYYLFSHLLLLLLASIVARIKSRYRRLLVQPLQLPDTTTANGYVAATKTLSFANQIKLYSVS